MIGQEQRIDAHRFRRAGHLAEVRPADGPPLAERAGADGEHESKPHPAFACHAWLLSISG